MKKIIFLTLYSLLTFQIVLSAAQNLPVTPRSALRSGAGVNTHFCNENSTYSDAKTAKPEVVAAIPALGVSMVRERYWPNHPCQKDAFSALAKKGVRFYLFIGDTTYNYSHAVSDIDALAKSDIASSVAAICGPNEPNKSGGDWPSACQEIQRAIHDRVLYYRSQAHPLFKNTLIVGPALMHEHVQNLDQDYRDLGNKIKGLFECGDFHFYPGLSGPFKNAQECDRARTEAFGSVPYSKMFQSETGWTGTKTKPDDAGRFSAEAILRNYLTGIHGTLLFEFIDQPKQGGDEAQFGLLYPDCRHKPAYDMLKELLTHNDGNEAFPGYLSSGDANTVVTSEGNGHWTVYFLMNKDHAATLQLPAGYKSDVNNPITFVDNKYPKVTLVIAHIRKTLSAPETPSDLTAVVQGYDQVNLSWNDNSNNEQGFKIERSVQGTGVFSEISQPGKDIQSYVDAGLNDGVTYIYRVRAWNNAGYSNYSNEVTATTPLKPTVSLQVTDGRTSEKYLGRAVWTVTRTGDTSDDLTISYGFSGTATYGVDYSVSDGTILGTVTIPSGQSTSEISARAIHDELSDPDETITCTLSSRSDYHVDAIQNTGTASIHEDK
jgi:hypothetical protein